MRPRAGDDASGVSAAREVEAVSAMAMKMPNRPAQSSEYP